MNGIEILSTAEVVTATACNTTAVWIGIIATIIVVAIIGIIVAWHEYDGGYIALFMVIGMMLSVFTAMAVASITSYPTAYETQYKVTIDDSVSMNEFNEKYEVVSQEGKIYTVRERK